MLRIPKILLFSSADAEAQAFKTILQMCATVTRVRTLAQLRDRIRGNPYDAVLCGSSAGRGQPKSAVETIQRIAGDVPVIFFSGSRGAEEWIEVLEAGALDLLMLPCSDANARAA